MPDTVPKGFVCITSFDQPTKAQRLSPFKLGTQQVKECGEVRTQIHVSPTAGLLLLPPPPPPPAEHPAIRTVPYSGHTGQWPPWPPLAFPEDGGCSRLTA